MKKGNWGNGSHSFRLTLAASVILQGLQLPVSAAEPVNGPVTRSASEAKLSTVAISVNKSRTQKISFAFSDVIIGQPDIAEVIPIAEQTLYILGKKVGTTNVSLYDGEKKLVGVIDLRINQDTIEGFTPDATAVERSVAVQPTTTVNNTKVAASQQVMLKVRFAEINRSAAREAGIRYDFARGLTGGSTPFTSVGGGQGASQISLTGSPYVSAGFSVGNIDVYLEALETRNLARRLAEPNLVAMSGETASFLAGGEFPIPVVGPEGQTTLNYKPFGVTLQFTPTVLEQGRIHLRVQPSVSDIASFSPRGDPIFNSRGASTSVELRDGQSFALAGLLQANSSRSADQVPWIGSIPIIGALFRSQEFQNNETELVVIVTPHLVKPAKPGQNLRTPLDTTVPANDADQFLVGELEVKKRPFENGLKINGKVTSQFGHILVPRPPVVKVPVSGSQAAVAAQATAPTAQTGVTVGPQPVTLKKPAVAKQ